MTEQYMIDNTMQSFVEHHQLHNVKKQWRSYTEQFTYGHYLIIISAYI